MPIQFDIDKFVGPKQAARYVALEKRKILLEKRFIINPEGTYRTFTGLIHSKKWDQSGVPMRYHREDMIPLSIMTSK